MGALSDFISKIENEDNAHLFDDPSRLYVVSNELGEAYWTDFQTIPDSSMVKELIEHLVNEVQMVRRDMANHHNPETGRAYSRVDYVAYATRLDKVLSAIANADDESTKLMVRGISSINETENSDYGYNLSLDQLEKVIGNLEENAEFSDEEERPEELFARRVP